MTLEIGICEHVSMQDSGYFLGRFGDIRQHASRKMVENDSKAVRGLSKGFVDDREHAQLSFVVCSRVQVSQVSG